MSPEGAVEPIRGTVTVRIDPARAFELFTEHMGSWWPVDAYSRAVSEFEGEGIEVTRLEFQARTGGSILEHTSDGRTLPWGEVIAWHPPHRVVMAWHPHSLPEPPTELEVTFTALEGGCPRASARRSTRSTSAAGSRPSIASSRRRIVVCDAAAVGVPWPVSAQPGARRAQTDGCARNLAPAAGRVRRWWIRIGGGPDRPGSALRHRPASSGLCQRWNGDRRRPGCMHAGHVGADPGRDRR